MNEDMRHNDGCDCGCGPLGGLFGGNNMMLILVIFLLFSGGFGGRD